MQVYSFKAAVFKLFDYGPLFSAGVVGGPPTLVTVKFTAKNTEILGHTAFYKQTNIINYIQQHYIRDINRKPVVPNRGKTSMQCTE